MTATVRYVPIVPKAKILQQDRILQDPNVVPVGDNLALPLIRLAARLRSEGIELHTSDMMPLEKFDAFYFSDMPGKKTEDVFRFAKRAGKATILSVGENHFIAPGNADFGRYRDFDAVLSYNDEAVEKYGAIKSYYSFDFSLARPSQIPFADRKFATMISACMKRNIPHNVSYLRLRTLEFYSRHHPDRMDLYGRGWDKGTYLFQDRPEVFRWTHGLFLDKLLPRRRFPVWRGPCGRKSDVLGKYRFVYCYENTDEIPGYITEKIFDVLMNGSVPVYLNHPSTDRYVPRDCYVNRRDFADDAALYGYLASMPESVWRGYLDSGRRFLASEAARPFSIERYCDVMSSVIRGVLAK